MKPRTALRATVAAALSLAAGAASAQDFKVSGFASLVVGRTSGACVATDAMATQHNDSCTRAIVDWGHGGVYQNKWTAGEETRAGIQGEWKLSKELTAVTQVSARTLSDQHVNLEWAYLSYSPTPDWKLQVGRKRIPLYYYSDFQDVGFAYNTVRPTPDVYGWDVVNYNGASLSHSQSMGDWNFRAEVYAGGENSRKNPYSTIFYDEKFDVRWGSLRGASLEFSKDWFTGRVSYTRSNFSIRDRAAGAAVELFDGSTRAPQSFMGLVLNGDWDEWQWRSEFGKARRMDAAGYDADFYLMTLGHQMGKFTLTAGLSAYKEKSDFDLDTYVPVKLSTRTLALRYDVHKGGAVKLQFDRVRDTSPSPLSGHSRLISLSYDLVF
ncbi:porin [Inhella gelatinilytica]|uniref:Porin n=1 Tax=Inhella gelatinilytica TaxID=2795030 RepID=A0A931IRP2_9BURK|nr:porin [Inhella gelatinilytica]MBH9551437.1 porin [Inhella gelatinilytica]